MITTALVFDHRGRASGDKEGPVELRVTIDRKVRYISTGVRCLRHHFQLGMIVDRYDSDVLNERLRIIKTKIEEDINAAMQRCETIDIGKIRKGTVSFTTEEDRSFMLWYEELIPTLRVSEGTREHYYQLYARLTEFGLLKSWSDLTVDNIYKFDQWARSLVSHYHTGLKDNTIYNWHKTLKSVLYRAYRIGLITYEGNPYSKLHGQFVAPKNENVEYLTDDEIEKILHYRPTMPHLETVRDLFIIQMFTGLSYRDTMELDLTRYHCIDGRWVNNGERVKTGVPYVSQLLPPVVEVLERRGWRVPYYSMQSYNKYLKQIGRELGITTRMHTHLARHTFATYMLRHGVKIENLARMLGHANIKHTQIYAKVLAQSVHEEFDMINEKLTKK